MVVLYITRVKFSQTRKGQEFIRYCHCRSIPFIEHVFKMTLSFECIVRSSGALFAVELQ